MIKYGSDGENTGKVPQLVAGNALKQEMVFKWA